MTAERGFLDGFNRLVGRTFVPALKCFQPFQLALFFTLGTASEFNF